MAFHEYSKDIVSKYLGTVSYVDDLIFIKRDEPSAAVIERASFGSIREKVALEGEGTAIKSDALEIDSGGKAEGIKQQLNPNIDPAVLTNAFLAKGIQCSLFEIENDEDSLEPLKVILKKSDVIILDWQMHKDNGRKALELLLSVIHSSIRPELRLYVIFTDDPQYHTLLSRAILPKMQDAGVIREIQAETECVYKFGHSKIVVLAKTNREEKASAVSDADLPGRIVEEFAEITSGLISNAVLKAITVIRRHSHNLLATFNKDMDAAYFNHRAFLDTPSNSELHMVNWITDEIKDLLYGNKVASEMNIEQIKLSLNSQETLEFRIYDGVGTEQKKISRELMINLLEEGCTEYNKKNEKNGNAISPKWFKHFYRSFAPSSSNINEKFATLSSLSSTSFTHDAHQIMTLGVLIKEDEDILVCIQPSCDSVRLKKASNFMFLKVERSADRFNLIIPNDDTYERLSILYKPDSIVLLTFNPTNGVVISNTDNGKEIFYDNSAKKFEWMGNLKFPFAQRIVDLFAYEISRVGLDEPEWLRRWGGDK